MPGNSGTDSALKKFLKTPILVDENMEDFSSHPVFVKRSEEAAEFIAKNGLPKSFKATSKTKSTKKAKSATRKA